jgi:hypothetical protein
MRHTPSNAVPSTAWVVASSTVLMALGWGLRGYIGGGPFGAMIPGAFIAVWLGHLLGLGPARLALVAVFGTVGVAFGGSTTYGQTLGFLRGVPFGGLSGGEAVAWGLFGTVVKGGVWGLLGGAMLGLGFVAHRLPTRRIAIMLAVAAVAAVAGIALVNEPRLLYFSNRLDRPRPEYWAGLLAAAVAILAGAWRAGVGRVPLAFGLSGLVGGAAGFGLGGVEMAVGFQLAPPLEKLPWWKFMEFTFGACLGAAWGLAASRLAGELRDPEPPPAAAPCPAWPASVATGAVLVGVGMVAWPLVVDRMLPALRAAPGQPLAAAVGCVLFGFTSLGCVLATLGHRWATVAWHVAITMTFAHAVIDLAEDLATEGGGWSAAAAWSLVGIATVLAAAGVASWQRAARPSALGLLVPLVWACVGVAIVRLLATAAPGTGLVARWLTAAWQHGIVFAIFIGCAVAFTAAAWCRGSSPLPDPSSEEPLRCA